MTFSFDSLLAQARDIKSHSGLVARAYICSLFTLGLLCILIPISITFIHPRAPMLHTLLHYYVIISVCFFTIPTLWVFVCKRGLGRWYMSYLVGCAHSIVAVFVVNATRYFFVPDMLSTVYFDAENQLGAVIFVVMVELCYFWAIAAIGSIFYVMLTTRIFNTMQSWYVDNPLLPNAPISPSRPDRAAG